MQQLIMGLVLANFAALAGLSACSGIADQATSTADTPRSASSSRTAAQPQKQPILAIGDSILDWNAEENRSIPDVIGQTLNRPVTNSAVSGAHVSHPDREAAEAGYDIRQQYDDQGWGWVVMNGGANDLVGDCACATCGAQLEEMISEDGLSGEIPDFVRAVTASGAQVMYVGYYAMPDDARFGFEQCNDEIALHNGRLMRMAEGLAGVWFVSAGDVLSTEDLTAYDEDRVHPSPVGSARVGEHVARAIASAEEE